MNNFALEIWDDEGARCTLYTVRWEDCEDSETNRFFNRFTKNPENKHYNFVLDLYELIMRSIKNGYGATDDFINRPKNRAQALPPKPTSRIEEIEVLGKNFPLRLYCYRVNEQLLILFNGGIKSARTDQDSPDLRTKFYEAQEFAKRIEEALRDGLVSFDRNKRILTGFQNELNIYL